MLSCWLVKPHLLGIPSLSSGRRGSGPGLPGALLSEAASERATAGALHARGLLPAKHSTANSAIRSTESKWEATHMALCHIRRGCGLGPGPHVQISARLPGQRQHELGLGPGSYVPPSVCPAHSSEPVPGLVVFPPGLLLQRLCLLPTRAGDLLSYVQLWDCRWAGGQGAMFLAFVCSPAPGCWATRGWRPAQDDTPPLDGLQRSHSHHDPARPQSMASSPGPGGSEDS